MAGIELLIVAWDGAPYELILELLRGGTLPNAREIFGEGSLKPLRSTIPPLTAPAWASFHLGVNPGKHGIIDFVKYSPGGKWRVHSSADLPYRTFWEIVADEIPVGFIGFPMGYPAKALGRGFWVPGFLAPKGAASYPREAMGIAERAAKGYPLNPPLWHPGGKWVGELIACIDKKTAASIALASEYKPLVVGIHYQVTDTVQHFLWGTEAVDEVFRAADRALGRLVEALSPKRVLVLSDHGMGPVKWEFHVNVWLWANGLLRLKGGFRPRLKRLLFSLGFTPWNFRWLSGAGLRALKGLFRKDLRLFLYPIKGLERIFLNLKDVDWRRSPALSPGGMGAISVRRGDVLRRLIEMLKDLRTPDGEEAIEGIYRKEELYRGERCEGLPELFVLGAPGILPVSHGLFLSPRPFFPAMLPAGHRPLGFVASTAELGIGGSPVIWELAPSVLRLLGIEPPEYMDEERVCPPRAEP